MGGVQIAHRISVDNIQRTSCDEGRGIVHLDNRVARIIDKGQFLCYRAGLVQVCRISWTQKIPLGVTNGWEVGFSPQLVLSTFP
jgi:hypothetical protein